MAGKVSKTARASMVDKQSTAYIKPCPKCGEALVATKVIKSPGQPGGMYWICSKDDIRIRI
jgi:predicted RNA-binding Zn-ribbon protein involved in translation (DUF1610 family)